MEFVSSKQQEYIEAFENKTGEKVLFEDLSLRSLFSKTLAIGPGVRKLITYKAPLHYFDGGWKDVDTALIPTGSGWEMNKAGYKLTVDKVLSLDSPFSFVNGVEEVGLRPRGLRWSPTEIIYQEVDAVEGSLVNNEVVYNGAFGPGLSLVLAPKNIGFRKLVKIDSLANLGSVPEGKTVVEVGFEILAPSDTEIWYENKANDISGLRQQLKDLDIERLRLEKEVKDYKAARAIHVQQIALEEKLQMAMKSKWDKVTDTRFTGSFLLKYTEGTKTYGFTPRVWDSAGNNQRIEIELRLRNGKFYLTKLIPLSFLQSAVFPVFTDTTTSFFFGSGDGHVRNNPGGGATWATVRGASTGTFADTAGALGVRAGHAEFYSGTDYDIWRGFGPTDTSTLPDTATITAGSVNAHASASIPISNGDTTDVDVVQGTQASTSALVNDDFDQVGSTVGGSKALSTITDDTDFSITLNATGLGWISKTGFTKIAFRNSRDTDNSAPTGVNRLNIDGSETSGTTDDPFLSLTYTTPLDAQIIVA